MNLDEFLVIHQNFIIQIFLPIAVHVRLIQFIKCCARQMFPDPQFVAASIYYYYLYGSYGCCLSKVSTNKIANVRIYVDIASYVEIFKGCKICRFRVAKLAKPVQNFNP